MSDSTGGYVCSDEFHVYPKTYAGSPEYAVEYFNRCLCGKKKKITTTTEVDLAKLGGRDE